MARTPLLIVRLCHCTGRDRPGGPGVSAQPASALGAQSLGIFAAAPAPCPPCVCVCRVPLPGCADAAALPLCLSWTISQAPLHPEQWLQCWQLPHILVSAEAWEPSLVPPEVLVRTMARGSPAASLGTKMPRPMRGFCSSLGCSPRTKLTVTVSTGKAVLLTVTQADGDMREESQPVRVLFFNISIT